MDGNNILFLFVSSSLLHTFFKFFNFCNFLFHLRLIFITNSETFNYFVFNYFV